MSALQLDAVSVTFGGLRALADVSFSVQPGEIVGLIGPNGAGKSTLLNAISGFVRPRAGRIAYGDVELGRTPPHRLTSLGIARTFQHPELFDSLDVRENCVVAEREFGFGEIAAGVFGAPNVRRHVARSEMSAQSALDTVGVGDWATQEVGQLPYGIAKLAELARALAAGPKLVLLDEPAAGLTTPEKARLGDVLRRLHGEYAFSIVIVEHDLGLVMSLCHRIVVLNFGRVISIGTPDEVKRDPGVIAAYLGAGHGA